MKTVQWAPSGNAMEGIPSEVVRLLADEDGKTYGYGYGPGWSMMFGSKSGDVTVQPGQYVTRHDDARIEVSDTPPNATQDAKNETELPSDATTEPENGTNETSGAGNGTERIILRDIDNRDDDMAPYEFEGTPEQVIGYLNGPLRGDLSSPDRSTAALELAIEAVRAGDLNEANGHLEGMSVHLRRPQ